MLIETATSESSLVFSARIDFSHFISYYLLDDCQFLHRNMLNVNAVHVEEIQEILNTLHVQGKLLEQRKSRQSYNVSIARHFK